MPCSGKLHEITNTADRVRRLRARGGPWRAPFSTRFGYIRLNKAIGLGFLFLLQLYYVVVAIAKEVGKIETVS
jgi:hypothetical protein